MMLFAAAAGAGLTIMHWIIIVVAVLAIIGIAIAASKQFGVPIPPFFIQVMWILIVAVVAIVAIKFLIDLVW